MLGRLLLLLSSAVSSSCDEPGGAIPSSEPSEERSPEVESSDAIQPGDLGFELDPANLDLGMLDATSTVQAEFAVVNTGRRELHINRIKGSCGCMQMGFKPGALAPGERRKVTLDIGPKRGEETKALTVQVEIWQGRLLQRTVGVNYYPRPKLSFKPPSLAFGRVAVGDDELERELIATADVPNGTDVTVLQLSTPEGVARPFHVEVGEASQETVGRLQRVHVPIRLRLGRAEPVPGFRTRVDLCGEWIEPSTFVVSGEVHPGWYLDPDKLHFGAVRVGRSRTRDVRLMYTVDPPPRIERVDSDRETFGASWRADESSRSLVLELTYTPVEGGEDRANMKVWLEGCDEALPLEVAGRVQ